MIQRRSPIVLSGSELVRQDLTDTEATVDRIVWERAGALVTSRHGKPDWTRRRHRQRPVAGLGHQQPVQNAPFAVAPLEDVEVATFARQRCMPFPSQPDCLREE